VEELGKRQPFLDARFDEEVVLVDPELLQRDDVVVGL
jgi:hypothetical protein